MTEAKHTPGPWIPSRFGYQVLTGDSWNTICELKGSPRWEDNRGCYDQEYDWQMREANARLIAAAPDLLEGCSILPVDWLDSGILTDSRSDGLRIRLTIEGTSYEAEITVGQLRLAAAALAKATGAAS